ncbi:MAG: leucyl/phenylalanyl-tRNA--protein transferase [Spirochaetales bacterium]|nr:leucyl/phenylalanyl-tRNA--protein transferase [Spirochaetales bacterium]
MRDEDFPWLEYDDYYHFPDPGSWDDDIIAAGGNLSPGLLISAYAQGIFPWFNEGEDILWWSLDPRFVLYPDNLHIGSTMKKVLKSRRFTVTVDKSFREVMASCGKAPRKDQDGTWISGEMIEAYGRLHDLGFAHSVEVWEGDTLAGGLYGLSLGRAFFGESMFARVPNSSKTALIALSSYLDDKNFAFIDCQQPTPHLGTMGAVNIPRERFIKELREVLETPTVRGNWSLLYPDFPASELWNRYTASPVGVGS